MKRPQACNNRESIVKTSQGLPIDDLHACSIKVGGVTYYTKLDDIKINNP